MADKLKHPGGRPLKFPTPSHMQGLIDKYFSDCEEKKKPYTITGLALALGTTRDLLCDYAGRPEFSDAIKMAKLRCENYCEEMLLAGGPAAGPIFALKNYGWRDTQDVNHGGQSGNPVEVVARPSMTRDEWLAAHGVGTVVCNGVIKEKD